MHEIVFWKRFVRAMKKIDAESRIEIVTAIEELARDPFDNRNVKALAGTNEPYYRLRVDRWRVVYLIVRDDRVIEVVDVFMKKSSADYRKRL